MTACGSSAAPPLQSDDDAGADAGEAEVGGDPVALDAGTPDGGEVSTCAGRADAGATGLPDPATVDPVLQPAEWTTSSLFALPSTPAIAKPAGSTDTVQLAFAQERPDNNAAAYEIVGEATATSDRVVRLAWDYSGQRGPFYRPADAPTFMQLYADGPEGRTAVTLHEGVATANAAYALSGTATVTIHAGYPFGVRIFDRSMADVSGNVTLTTLESRPIHEVVPPAPTAARPPCSITEPNQAPTLVLGPDLHLDTDPKAYVGLRWAELAPGPSSEAYQRVAATLTVTATTGTLSFDAPPTMNATGDLFFTTTPGTFGTATVHVELVDDGGTADGGADKATGSFEIRVNTPPQLPRPNQFGIKNSPSGAVGTFCVGGDDVDPYAAHAIEFVAYPTKGYFDPGYYTVDGHGWAEVHTSKATGVSHCFNYIVISTTFAGFDAFEFRIHDFHGGVSAPVAVSVTVHPPD